MNIFLLMAGRGVKGGGRAASPITAFAWEGHQCPSPGRRQCGSGWGESSRIWKQHPGTTSTMQTFSLERFSHSSLKLKLTIVKLTFVQEALKACQLVNAPLLYRAANRLPYSVLKYAMTIDGTNQSPKFHLACA
jgi:hypothetical protein